MNNRCGYLMDVDGKPVQCKNLVTSFKILLDDDENPFRKYDHLCATHRAKMNEICTACKKSREMHDEWRDDDYDGHNFVGLTVDEKKQILRELLS